MLSRRREERGALLASGKPDEPGTNTWLAAILNSSEDAVTSGDLEGRITGWNAGAQRLYGYSTEEAIGRSVTEIMKPVGGPEVVARNIGRLLRGERVAPFEAIHYARDGGELRVSVALTPLKNSAGEMVGVLAINRDVTARGQAEEELKESYDLLWAVMEGTTDAIFVKDLQGRYKIINQAGAEVLGQSIEQIVGKTDTELFGAEDGREVVEADQEILDSGETRTTEDTKTMADGVTRAYLVTRGPYRDGNGEVAGVFGISRDITGRKEAERALKENEELFRYMVQNSSDTITLVGADGIIRYVSPAIEHMLGYEAEEKVGDNLFDLVHPNDVPRARNLFSHGLRNPDIALSIELRMRHKDGSWRHVEVVGTNLLDDPSAGAVVLNSRDVTERKKLEEELTRRALHDHLTGLPNRALLMDHLRQALARAKRREKGVAVLFLDVDNFKVVNDSLGHEAGDRLLVEAARRLTAVLRPEDTVARLGGDEFVVLVEETTTEEAAEVAGRLQEGLHGPLSLDLHETFLTVSMGLAFSDAEHEPQELLRRADLAMYGAKAAGKARWVPFNREMDEEARERLSIERDLRRALKEQELLLLYQPLVCLENKKIVGFEALLRWDHSEEGRLLPERFMPVAEETGLIIDIGAWALREACLTVRSWCEQYPEASPRISVNISPTQLLDAGFLSMVEDVVSESRLGPSELILEITEDIFVQDTLKVAEVLENLRALGVGLSIDDFGTGYSSLAYLSRIPMNFLKIDRSVVFRLEEDPRQVAIALAVVTLAHSLGAKVVAEGIETSAQLDLLGALDCDMGQGEHFWLPQPPHEAIELYRTKSG